MEFRHFIGCLCLFTLFYLPLSIGQNVIGIQYNKPITWCTVNIEEQWKCRNLSRFIENDFVLFNMGQLKLQCIQGFNKEECMTYLDEEKAQLTSLDAGEVFVGGRYHSLVPIMQEQYAGSGRNYYAVAVINRRKATMNDVHSLYDLRGKRACFAGVGSQAGWVIPVYELMKHGGMDVIDCNNHVKSAINYFGPSCAVNSLINKYNPIGDNSDKLCQICIGKIPGERCTSSDPYAGFEGAFRCLIEAGDIAFLKHTTVQEMISNSLTFSGFTKNDFELLCRDGTRRSVDQFRECNWGSVPSHAIVTSSAKSIKERRMLQQFLKTAAKLYGPHAQNNTSNQYGPQGGPGYNPNDPNIPYDQRFNNPNQGGINNPQGFNVQQNPNDLNVQGVGVQPAQYDQRGFGNEGQGFIGPRNQYDQQFGASTNFPPMYEYFRLFESVPRYGIRHNLLVQDTATDLVPIDENHQTHSGYLGSSLKMILGIRECPVRKMTLCVTSDPELEKCVKMRIALKAQLLKPEMVCHKGHSQINCMQAVQSGLADVAVLDAGDVYTAGLQYDLVPFISEVYNLGKPEYYVVAVAKEQDPSTELTYLKGKYTCHTGINTAAGWIVPLAYLISNGWIRSYGCNSIRAAAEYFTKSCVPGALSSEYNTDVPYDNMCDLCHGGSFRYCRRDASEDYYGHTGALRCLVEGGGEVAFVKHTTVTENTDGKRREWWARNALIDDFELLCPDGTRAPMQEFKRCNLGTAKANAIVARGGQAYNETQLSAYINLFVYAQQFYGRKDQDDFSFSMFYSTPPYSDLIFQDAAQQLRIIPREQRYYSSYLGPDFMRARRIVDCHAGTARGTSSLIMTVLVLIIGVLMGRGVV